MAQVAGRLVYDLARGSNAFGPFACNGSYALCDADDLLVPLMGKLLANIRNKRGNPCYRFGAAGIYQNSTQTITAGGVLLPND